MTQQVQPIERIIQQKDIVITANAPND